MTKWNAHTIRERLIEKSKVLGLRLPQMQMLLAQERFLARLFSITEGKFFIWKGGSLLLRKYSTLDIPRYTVDIDLLLRGTDFSNTLSILEKASKLSLNDGFEFSEIKVTPMKRETPYGGDRFDIQWTMFGKTQSAPLRIDICAGDVVTPITSDFSDIIFLPKEGVSLTAQIYPPEFIFAEKLETLFRFGTGSTRCKDLIDLWSLSKLGIDIEKLKASIEACFNHRQEEFSLERLREILEDDFFIKNTEKMSQDNFSYLNLPPISKLVSELLTFCQKELQ